MTQKSPFHEIHVQSSAVMEQECGWLIPRHYGDTERELQACKEAIAVIDESNMYRIGVSGSDAENLLGRLFGNRVDVGSILPGEQGYGKLQRAQRNGGEGELCRILHLQKGYMLIGSAADYDYVLGRLNELCPGMRVKIQDQTRKTAMVFMTGPEAITLLKNKLPFDTSSLRENGIIEQTLFLFVHFIIVQVGVPTEGAIIILPAVMADKGWGLLEKYGKEYGIQLVGHDVRNMLYNEQMSNE